MAKTELHILGAGPAGLSAAIVLARAGRTVHIHERYDTVGKRFRGDLQGLDNWSTKENVLDIFQSFGLTTHFDKTPFCNVTLTNGRHTFTGNSDQPLFYLVKRGPFPDSIDTALYHQAKESGVNFHFRSRYPEESSDIIATGPIRESTIAADKGIVFKTDLPNMAIGIFNDDLAYLGYSYLLVAQGYGCLCTVVFKDLHRLNECFERTLEWAQNKYSIDISNGRPVGGVGSFSLDQPSIKGTSLLAGEAAGLQDMLWGFGIRTAITSGYLAAQSILHKQDYSELLTKNIYPSLKASVVNRFLWEKCKSGPYTLLPYLMKFPVSLRTQFRHLYRFSPLHRMLFPFAKNYMNKEYPSA